jgi:hypothetical protein
MAAPKTAKATSKGRYYTNPRDPEKPLISVTNVLDAAIGKPALVGWAARTVAEQAVARLPIVTKLSRTDPAAAVQLLKGTPYAEKDTAAKLGTRIHELAEAHELGQGLPDDLLDDEKAMVENYLAWREDWKPVFEATEATVRNYTVGYAGTCDGLIRFPDFEDRLPGLYALDYKTGKTGPYPEWALQVGGAYAHAETLVLPDGTDIPMPRVDGAIALRIRPDRYAMHLLRSDELVRDTFRHMVAVARFLHSTEDPFSAAIPLIPEPADDADLIPVSA